MKYVKTEAIRGVQVEFNFDEPKAYREISNLVKRLFKRFDWNFKNLEFYIYPNKEKYLDVVHSMMKRHKIEKELAFKDPGLGLIEIFYFKNYPIYMVNVMFFNEMKSMVGSSIEGAFAHDFFHAWDIATGYKQLADSIATVERRKFNTYAHWYYFPHLHNGISDLSADDKCVKNGFSHELFCTNYYGQYENLLKDLKKAEMPITTLIPAIFAMTAELSPDDIPFRHHGHEDKADKMREKITNFFELSDKKCPVKRSWVEIERELNEELSKYNAHLSQEQLLSVFESQGRLLYELMRTN